MGGGGGRTVWNSKGKGGLSILEFPKARGGLDEDAARGRVWIFSGITHCEKKNVIGSARIACLCLFKSHNENITGPGRRDMLSYGLQYSCRAAGKACGDIYTCIFLSVRLYGKGKGRT